MITRAAARPYNSVTRRIDGVRLHAIDAATALILRENARRDAAKAHVRRRR